MTEMTMKYRIKKFDEGTIAFIIKRNDERGESFVVLSKTEIKELIQDLLKCLKHIPSIAGDKDKR